MIGEVLAERYRIEEEIGAGGMGSVYRATDLRTGGQVAVKLPHPWLARDPTFNARLRREAEIAASLTSPRVVRVIDLHQHEGRPFLVMEYVPGDTLAELLVASGALPWRQAGRIAIEVARALDAAAQRGIVHRDLKPQNIKVVDTDIKVLDFGIARAQDSVVVTSASVLVGTPEYVAPERLGTGDDLTADPAGTAPREDIRSDIYSLGIILYEMLTGAPPFRGGTPWQVIRQHERQEPPPLPESIPLPMRTLVLRSLAKRPEQRYQTPRDVVVALERVLATAEVPLPPTTPLPRPEGAGAGAAPARSSVGAASPTTASPLAVPPPSPPSGGGAPPGATRPPATGRRSRLPVFAGGAAVVVLAGGAALYAVLGRGGGESPAVTQAPTTATQAAATATATPAVAANDTVIGTLTAQPVTNARGPIEVCYSYSNAQEVALTVVVLRGGTPVATSQPFRVTRASGQQCESLTPTSPLTAGQYTVQVRDDRPKVLKETQLSYQPR